MDERGNAAEGARPVQDAATILIYRNPDAVELFMVKRHSRSGFMANAMVFPGGRVEPDDLFADWGSRCDLDAQSAATRLRLDDPNLALGHYVAAIRETFEEAGVLFAQSDTSSRQINPASTWETERAALNAGQLTFRRFVQSEELRLNTAHLKYLARWVTPKIEKRRFDTKFFAAEVSAQQFAAHDDQETTDSAWMTPSAVLRDYAQGSLELAPPTLRILTEIARDPSVLTGPGDRTPEVYAPQPISADGALHLLLPGDVDYQPPGERINRISRLDNKWRTQGHGF